MIVLGGAVLGSEKATEPMYQWRRITGGGDRSDEFAIY